MGKNTLLIATWLCTFVHPNITITVDILYFSHINNSQNNLLAIILNKKNIRYYVDHIQNILKYTGTITANKLSWLRIAIEFSLKVASETDVKFFIRAQTMQKTIKYIRKLLNKTICQQRLKQAQLSQGEESEVYKITLKYTYFMNMPQCTHTYTLYIYIYILYIG